MKISITLDVDVEETGYKNKDEFKDNIVEFSRDLIINGAENEEVALTLLEVEYES